MALPNLIEPEALDGLPGGPYTEEMAEVGAHTVRRAARWHIAPVIKETIILDHDGAGVVRLPSLRVVDVLSVVDISRAEDRPLEYRRHYRWSEAGLLSGKFPAGFRVLSVTLEHGFDECPPELLPVIAQASKEGRTRTRQAGPFQETYEAGLDSHPTSTASVLSLYSLGPRP